VAVLSERFTPKIEAYVPGDNSGVKEAALTTPPSVIIGTIARGVTATVTVDEVTPPGLVAVKVYRVLTVGVTVTLPEVGTVPTPWLMATEAASVTHESVTGAPSITAGGAAVKLTMVGKPVTPGMVSWKSVLPVVVATLANAVPVGVTATPSNHWKPVCTKVLARIGYTFLVVVLTKIG
jgi:hypothetical protein